MGRNTKINIAIVVVSTITTFLQALFLSVSSFYSHISIQIVNAVLSATIVALESFQLNIKRLKLRSHAISAQRSRENSVMEVAASIAEEEVQFASIARASISALRSVPIEVKDLSTGEAEVGEK